MAHSRFKDFQETCSQTNIGTELENIVQKLGVSCEIVLVMKAWMAYCNWGLIVYPAEIRKLFLCFFNEKVKITTAPSLSAGLLMMSFHLLRSFSAAHFSFVRLWLLVSFLNFFFPNFFFAGVDKEPQYLIFSFWGFPGWFTKIILREVNKIFSDFKKAELSVLTNEEKKAFLSVKRGWN